MKDPLKGIHADSSWRTELHHEACKTMEHHEKTTKIIEDHLVSDSSVSTSVLLNDKIGMQTFSTADVEKRMEWYGYGMIWLSILAWYAIRLSSCRLRCIAPPHPAGPVTISVSFDGGATWLEGPWCHGDCEADNVTFFDIYWMNLIIYWLILDKILFKCQSLFNCSILLNCIGNFTARTKLLVLWSYDLLWGLWLLGTKSGHHHDWIW